MENHLKCLCRFFKIKILHTFSYASNEASLCLWISEYCEENSPWTFSLRLRSVHFGYFPCSLRLSSAEVAGIQSDCVCGSRWLTLYSPDLLG